MNYRFNSEDILITQLGEEGVAFNSETNEYFSLNETSFKILKGIEAGLSEAEVCEQLQKEYDISAEVCKQEVQNTVQLFHAKKLVVKK